MLARVRKTNPEQGPISGSACMQEKADSLLKNAQDFSEPSRFSGPSVRPVQLSSHLAVAAASGRPALATDVAYPQAQDRAAAQPRLTRALQLSDSPTAAGHARRTPHPTPGPARLASAGQIPLDAPTTAVAGTYGTSRIPELPQSPTSPLRSRAADMPSWRSTAPRQAPLSARLTCGSM